MFDNIPFNNSIVESTWFHIKADESSTSNTFLFEKSSTTDMLWKIKDSSLSAKISLGMQANVKLSAGTILDFTPRPLNTWAKSVELFINEVTVTVTHTVSLKVSSMINILLKKKSMHSNLAGVTMGWLDTLRKTSYLHQITADNHVDNTQKSITNNAGAKKQRESIINADPRCVVDRLIVPLFYGGDQYLKSSNKLYFKWNKDRN